MIGPAVLESDVTAKIQRAFRRCMPSRFFITPESDVNVNPYADISIATLGRLPTASFSSEITPWKKFIFIQGTMSRSSIRRARPMHWQRQHTVFGFHVSSTRPACIIFITSKTIKSMRTILFPAVDHTVFFPEEKNLQKEESTLKLFFYGRPHHERKRIWSGDRTAKRR